jgi:hypothetical protein
LFRIRFQEAKCFHFKSKELLLALRIFLNWLRPVPLKRLLAWCTSLIAQREAVEPHRISRQIQPEQRK